MGIGRGAAPRTRAAFAQLCGVALALGAIATAFDRAYAANVDLSEIFDILDADRDGVVGRGIPAQEDRGLLPRAHGSGWGPALEAERDQHHVPGLRRRRPQRRRHAVGVEFVQARFMQFDAIDTSGDQEITLEEFREFIPQYQP